jgi:enediyne biosynthesis protein E5
MNAAPFDARYWQLLFLLSLLSFGLLARDFSLQPLQVALAVCCALATQAFWLFRLQLPERRRLSGYLSAIVSAIGLSILVRSDVYWVHPALATLAISSKFVLRFGQGRARTHVFNPANLAAFSAMTWMPHAWLSPGQWGQELLAAFWIAGLGLIVSGRVGRCDISLSLLGFWLSLLALRLWWLDYAPQLAWAMWRHQVFNGATLLFAFFMISDPMTTPHQRSARIAYAACVALTALIWQYGYFLQQGLIAGLFLCSFCVPLLNRYSGGARFQW